MSKDVNEPGNFFDMSIEELMEVPIIVSTSRQEQKVTESSVPISIITAEDIHYSGLTNIPEILQFSPGVDVRKFERNRYAVGVHGLLSRISDRTLVLINGRYAGDLFYGGAPDWSNLPVLMEDIERIEVVRGPESAAWGANAFTGVINIITKKSEDVIGYFGSTTINEFGDSYTHIRYADKKDKWGWRLSAGYENFEDSDAAGTGKYKSGMPALNTLIGFDGYSADDFMRNWRFDSEAEYQYSDETKLSFGAGHSSFESGSHEYVGYYPESDNMGSLTRSFARIDHKFDNGSTGYLQWFGNFLVNHQPHDVARYATDEHRFEGQLNFELADKHNISIGGDTSLLHTAVRNDNPNEAIFSEEPFSEQWGGLFLIDRFEVTDRLMLEGQIRGDLHSENDKDWSMRATALYSLDNAKKHILRFGVAKAFRTPCIIFRELTSKTGVFGLFNVLPPSKHLHNENIWSLETGYMGELVKGVKFSTNAYYQRMENMIGTDIQTVGMVTNGTFANIDGATNIGIESELSLVGSKGKVSAWYTYDHFVTDQHDQCVRALGPATHKAGLTGRLFLPDGWIFNTNCVVNSGITAPDAIINAPSFNRVDLTISRRFATGKGEFMVGVSDLFNKTNKVTSDVGELTGHETPGRTFFARMQLKF